MAVLVVEDDDQIRDFVTGVLEDAGYKVCSASDGALGLREVDALIRAECELRVILLDMRMPNMDGWEFARRYRELHDHQAPIIVMTAASDAKARAAQINADGVLPKPFDLSRLLDVVESAA